LLKKELGDYMDFQMGLGKLKTLLPEETQILQVNGPWLEFTRMPALGVPLETFASSLKAEGRTIEPALFEALKSRLPSGRLYVHQERAIRAMLAGKSVVLSHPTGSGKTEAFVVPILQYLLHEIREAKEYGLGCIMIFPMKALENDQRDRLKGFLYQLENKLGTHIPFMAVYDGDTPTRADFERVQDNDRRDQLKWYREKCPRCGKETLRYNMGDRAHLLKCEQYLDDSGELVGCGYPEEATAGIPWIRTTREDMRANVAFPNIVITNPEALDYRLLMPEDGTVFATRMPKIIVVIDEAHSYTTGTALSLRFLLSRLEEKVRRLAGRPVTFQYVISSATLDEPASFATRLVPWADFEVVPFEGRSSPFESFKGAQSPLEKPLVPVDLDNLDWAFEQVGQRSAESKLSGPLLDTLVQLGILSGEGGKLIPGSEESRRAVSEYVRDNRTPAYDHLKAGIGARLASFAQVTELYRLLMEGPKSLEGIAEWWMEKWPGWSLNQVEETVSAIVLLGRHLKFWEERWHVFVKSPTGIAGCSGEKFHAYSFSMDEPLPNRCRSCGPSALVMEVLTCQDCAEVYLSWYRCDVCLLAGPNRETVCIHEDEKKALFAVRVEDVTGKTKFSEFENESSRVARKNPKCPECSGKLTPVRRRTDLIIDMSVSLMGWYADDLRRKFLLFTDSRAASERIGREFNNMEIVIWAERLLMQIMTRDQNHSPHAPRLVPEVKKKLFAYLFRPYNLALKRVLRKYEDEKLVRSLNLAAFKALGKSTSGVSRLFDHGLLGYAFDDFAARVRSLDLEGVLPRVSDLVRRHASYENGIKLERLIALFKKGHPAFEAVMQTLGGLSDERIHRSLDVLENEGWLRRIQRGSEVFYLLNEGDVQESADPFSVARDVRKIKVPESVRRCSNCGLVRWYAVDVCERCGSGMQSLSHGQLLDDDYFARVLVREPRPIVAAIHRGGLDPFERRLIEERFRAAENSIHFLCATPTLELGIDVGFLNFVLLARIPPAKSNYIQRVGRAGRRQKEGAICVTFTYPTPIDAYYFRNPQALVAMKAGRLPVQKLSVEQLSPFLWSSLCDAFASDGPVGLAIFDSGVRMKDFLEGRAPYKIEDLRQEMISSWPTRLKSWIREVASRCIMPGVDNVDSELLEIALSDLGSKIEDSSAFTSEIMRLDAFNAEKQEVDKLHATIARRRADLIAEKNRTSEEQEELDRLQVEDQSLEEYKKNRIASSSILIFLHDAGVLSTPRGIGSNVSTHDLGWAGRVIDQREVEQAVAERFPGGLISRQGAIYEVRKVVYDPINRPSLRLCSTCDRWLVQEPCADHPEALVKVVILEMPLVAFAGFTWLPSRETRGNRHQYLRVLEQPGVAIRTSLGKIGLNVSNVHPVQVSTTCGSYETLEQGQRIRETQLIQTCTSCGSFTTGSGCCDNPHPRHVVQGFVYETRGIRLTFNESELAPRLADASEMYPDASGVAADKKFLQSLANGLLNAIAIVLGTEPSMLDAVVNPDFSLTLFEPMAGGLGLLDELLVREEELNDCVNRLVALVKTVEGEHDCDPYCDRCLIVPRYSNEELRFLHRPLLEHVLGVQNG